jgi:hypothetical protein
VVRRLIEEQQVRVRKKQPTKSHPALLSTGQRADRRVVGRTAQSVHRDLDVALDVPRPRRVDLVFQRGLLGTDGLVVGIRVGPLGHDRVVLLDQAVDLAHAVEDVLLDGLLCVELGLLAEVANGEAGRQPRFAVVAVIEPRHDPQEARFARSIGPDNPDLGARIERYRDVLEHRPIGRVVPGQLVRGVDELGRHGAKGYRGFRSAATGVSREALPLRSR